MILIHFLYKNKIFSLIFSNNFTSSFLTLSFNEINFSKHRIISSNTRAFSEIKNPITCKTLMNAHAIKHYFTEKNIIKLITKLKTA